MWKMMQASMCPRCGKCDYGFIHFNCDAEEPEALTLIAEGKRVYEPKEN